MRSGLYGVGVGLYGGTLPTYDSTAEFLSKCRLYGGTWKMRTLRRSFSKNTYHTACGPWLSLYISIFINKTTTYIIGVHEYHEYDITKSLK